LSPSKPKPSGGAVRQSERADQPLALTRGTLARGRKLGRELDIEGFLARLIELVHGAGLAQLLGELGGGFGGGDRLRERGSKLLRGGARYRARPESRCG
jgi:hypothetical protein